ncbi:MAG: MBL fold metallo-hydrolase [Gammaproteobacteria bacterium]|nr:MBL fold metallo-hydrolase [Gammaproteobacteria bacterium]
MKITLLGTGGPKPDPNRQGSGVLLNIERDDYLLFDAGRGVSTQLVRAGITPQVVNPIFITHHHFDHIGNLADVILSAWNNGRIEPLHIIGPAGTADIVLALLNQVYAGDIKFRLTEAALSETKLVDVREMVKVRDVEPDLVYDNKTWQVYAEYVEHGHGLGITRKEWPCFGYRVEAEGNVIAISGDTVDCAGLDRLAQGADVLIQCCYLPKDEMTNPDSKLIAKHILACSPQVGKIAGRAGVKVLVLTHFREKSEVMMHSVAEDVRKDYDGELYLGEDLMAIDV